MLNDTSMLATYGRSSPVAAGFGDHAFAAPSLDLAPKPIDKLFFPKELVSEVGMCKHQISFLKHKGCRFYGRKTTLRWIWEFLNEYTSGEALC